MFFSLSKFRLSHVSLGALFVVFIVLSSSESLASPRFGLWVEVEGKNQPFRSKEDFNTFQQFTEEGRYTDLYCQVYRGGRAWFPTVLADDTPYQQAKEQGFDPLRDTISAAHSRGARVHAWINVLRIRNDGSLPLLRALGPEVILTDNYGNSLLDYSDEEGIAPGKLGEYYKLGTPGVWLDPSYEKLRKYLVETIKDVIAAYPQIDGIHLDMIRYPSAIYRSASSSANDRPDFGYSTNSITKFYQFAGRPSPVINGDLFSKLRSGPAWDSWRRAQVTLLVYEIKEMINQTVPNIELSAAVIPSAERALNDMFQDWPSWLKGGMLDTAVLMDYTDSTTTVARDAKSALHLAAGYGKIVTGLGAWLLINKPTVLNDEAKAALKAGTTGINLFSYSNLLSSRGRDVVQELRQSAFPALQ